MMPCTIKGDVHKIGRKKIHVEWKMAKIRMFLCRYAFPYTTPYVCMHRKITLAHLFRVLYCNMPFRIKLTILCLPYVDRIHRDTHRYTIGLQLAWMPVV